MVSDTKLQKYRLISEEEPSDELLLTLMHRVSQATSQTNPLRVDRQAIRHNKADIVIALSTRLSQSKLPESVIQKYREALLSDMSYFKHKTSRDKRRTNLIAVKTRREDERTKLRKQILDAKRELVAKLQSL